MQNVYVGIDIGGTNTSIGLVNNDGIILSKTTIKTTNYETIEDYVKALYIKINELKNKINLPLAGIGIGAPNGNYYSGAIENAVNIKWKGIIPISNMIENYTGLKTLLTNDANAAAIGELYYGGAKGMKDFITITLGTGIGGGIVINGNIMHGHNGLAGEIGHMILFPVEGRKCNCGRQGCFEAYCNANGIVTTYLELSNKNIKNLTPKIILELALQGDKYALKTYNKTGEILGLALANCICIFNPEAIFLFGGIIKANDLLFKTTLESLEKNIPHMFKGKTKILKSILPEADAAILGAAALNIKQINFV
ncbi:MAG TPA: ROK family protein [Bacteroidales bacterium]|nr:ROK family protein [Bacteroidales bacterium]